VPITWVEYRVGPAFEVVTFETASRNGEPFEAMITKKNYLPNPVARFCTEELKVKTINRYFDSINFEPDTMVGVRADEPRRLPKLRARGLLVPLAQAGVTQAMVQKFWKDQPFDLELEFHDGVTAAGNCDLCFLKGAGQILSLIQAKPERAIWWANMEQKIDATFRSDRPSYAQMAKFAEQQQDMFDPQEEGIACFCGD
jgi:3'-phosphoadenosine 5'-phosphosulfate sulfotransferase (PAPS reductase)/FAD synthetase